MFPQAYRFAQVRLCLRGLIQFKIRPTARTQNLCTQRDFTFRSRPLRREQRRNGSNGVTRIALDDGEHRIRIRNKKMILAHFLTRNGDGAVESAARALELALPSREFAARFQNTNQTRVTCTVSRLNQCNRFVA